MFRESLWPPTSKDSLISGFAQTRRIPILEVHELAAGKFAALFSRHASRDLFDSHHLLLHQKLVIERLRVAFLVYGAINRKDWRGISATDVIYNKVELRRELLPLLRTSVSIDSWDLWAERMVVELQSKLKVVLPFSEREMEFLDRLLTHGEIQPQLLTDQEELIERIRHHPGLEWKALNVLWHKGNK